MENAGIKFNDKKTEDNRNRLRKPTNQPWHSILFYGLKAMVKNIIK